MRSKIVFWGVVLAVAMLAAACAGIDGGEERLADLAGSYDQLVNAMEMKDLDVEQGGSVVQPFFEPEGQVLVVEGQDVQVFEFSAETEAASAAGSISPDGSSIGTSMVNWVADPHFYHSGRLVVIYLGSDGRVLSALEDVVGAQIAGR